MGGPGQRKTGRAGDSRLLWRLLQHTCRSVQWGARSASTARRLDLALAAHTLHIRTPNVDLRARLTEDLTLAIAVRVHSWNEAADALLSGALDEDPSLLAALVRAEWRLVRAACKAAEHAAGRLLLLTTVPEA